MEPLYDVCFAGQLLDGQELQSVRNKIQKLFKANPETLEKLFSGQTQVLKRGCDRDTALKYKKAMEAAGAKPMIRACEITADPEPAEPAVAAEDSNVQNSPPDEQNFDLAPVGTDVLRPEERKVPAHTDVDVSHLNLAAAGTTLGQPDQATHNSPDTSHLSMGEVGEDIPNLPDTRTAIAPNTNDISLAPEGGDFSDCAPPNDAGPELDLSAIELAPAGVDVLEEQYKKSEKASAPETSHLSLDP
jgi:hypothetical protein